ncbi:MAG TPA: HAMP domain-containing sensor histidine kinase [Terriglobales bacterium]|nr:HAMP domain-containing sensor histidine kinase [Terriglobales bacterium]
MSSLAVLASTASPIAAPEQQALARAFASFTEAATSLEHSYSQLQSEIGRLRAELQQANADLEKERECARKLQALAEVSTMLAHEIRNPLGSMELFASLLAELKLPPSQHAWVEHIQAGLRSLAATVNNVLQLHADAIPNLLPTDIGDLLHGALEFLGPLARQAEVRIELRNELVGVRILADPHRLQQVILNLVLNALNAMPQGGRVLLTGRRFREKGEWVELEVSDNGPGISPEHLDHIFEPGFTTRPGSAGLGLAVCKTLLDQHHGEIHVSSMPGQGTTFLARLPGDNA